MKRKEAIIGATLVAIVVAGFYGKSELNERDVKYAEIMESMQREREIDRAYTMTFIKSMETTYGNNQLWNYYIDGRDTFQSTTSVR